MDNKQLVIDIVNNLLSQYNNNYVTTTISSSKDYFNIDIFINKNNDNDNDYRIEL